MRIVALVAGTVLLLVGAVVVAVNVVGVSAPVDAIAPGTASAPGSTARYIARVDSEQVTEGTVYHVRPTRAGRLASRDELDVAWRQAVRAGVPDKPGLRAQFLCHPLSIVARAKPTWDLEAWRPAVGLARTMLAGCDPD